MTQTATAPAPRPSTPAAPFELFELIRDGEELVATGSHEQMLWDAADSTLEARLEGDDTSTYAVVPADLTDCPKGLRGELCVGSEHAMHGVPTDERPDGY